MTQPYTKFWLSYSDQVTQLENRGLVIPNRIRAEQFLGHLNYYRFSGYCLAFEQGRHVFFKGTSFDDIIAAYEFDLGLRDLVTEALEVIEVDLRAKIAYYFGNQYQAFGHVDPGNFFVRFYHQDWLDRLHEEANRSSEIFVQHFKNTYQEFPDLPVWIATEIMSFGALSRMLKGMVRSDQKAIARSYGLQSANLEDWMHHSVYIRNLCAHHSRLWDRTWPISPSVPAGKAWKPPLLPNNRRVFVTLLLLRYWLKRIPAAASFANEWKKRVETHMQRLPTSPNALARLGMTPDWSLHPVWW